MNIKMIFSILLLSVLISCTADGDQFSKSDAAKALDGCKAHYINMMNTLPDSVLPRNFENGELKTSGTGWWCSGFYPGTLWYLYEYFGDDTLKNEAIRSTNLIEKEKYNTGTHDLGFMLYCSFGNGYRLTGYTEYKEIMVTGANSLITRFDSVVGCIKSWDHGTWQFPVIIDNMMNLEFLFWATKTTGNDIYYDICTTHADNTIKNHYRDDYSCWHVVDYDTITGEVAGKFTAQGYSDESAWARGQAWGLYGYTMTYRETKDSSYLNHAIQVADFILDHPNLPEDKIPYWDFNAPEIPEAKRDASSGAIIASALLELCNYAEQDKKEKYYDCAVIMLQSLSSEKYFAEIGTNGNFILKHSVGSIPHGSEIDVPLTYADYYYVEALTRFLNM